MNTRAIVVPAAFSDDATARLVDNFGQAEIRKAEEHRQRLRAKDWDACTPGFLFPVQRFDFDSGALGKEDGLVRIGLIEHVVQRAIHISDGLRVRQTHYITSVEIWTPKWVIAVVRATYKLTWRSRRYLVRKIAKDKTRQEAIMSVFNLAGDAAVADMLRRHS